MLIILFFALISQLKGSPSISIDKTTGASYTAFLSNLYLDKNSVLEFKLDHFSNLIQKYNATLNTTIELSFTDSDRKEVPTPSYVNLFRLDASILLDYKKYQLGVLPDSRFKNLQDSLCLTSKYDGHKIIVNVQIEEFKNRSTHYSIDSTDLCNKPVPGSTVITDQEKDVEVLLQQRILQEKENVGDIQVLFVSAKLNLELKDNDRQYLDVILCNH